MTIRLRSAQSGVQIHDQIVNVFETIRNSHELGSDTHGTGVIRLRSPNCWNCEQACWPTWENMDVPLPVLRQIPSGLGALPLAIELADVQREVRRRGISGVPVSRLHLGR